MPQINLQKFEHIAHSNRDATVRLDTRTGQLRVDGKGFFRRAVRWVQDRWDARSGNVPDRSAERYGAYNAFLRAIANDFYAQNDVKGIESRFLTDTFLEQDLSTRSIRQVLDHLHQSDFSARRNIIRVANYVSGQKNASGEQIGTYFSRTLAEKIGERPVLDAAGYSMNDEQRAALGQKILDAVMEKIDAGDKARFATLYETMGMGHAVADGLIDAALHEAEAALRQPEPAPPPRHQAATRQPTIAAQPGTGESQSISDQPLQQTEEQRKAAFEQLLGQTELRGSETDKARLRNAVQNADSEVDAIRLMNQQTVKYLEENRLQTLYNGVVSSEMKGEPVPQELQQLIQKELGSRKQVMPYSEAKVQVRAIVKNYVEAHDPGTLRKQLKAADLPKAVHQEVQSLIKSGKIVDRKSLAEHGNRCLVDWIVENRIGYWYAEETSRQGGAVTPAQGNVTVPQRMLLAVTDTVVKRPTLWPYALLKDISRRIVTSHVRAELSRVKV